MIIIWLLNMLDILFDSQETQKSSLYEICSNGHKLEGNLFCLELSKVEWNNFLFQSSQQNKEELIVCESDATGALKPGDRWERECN